MRARRIITVVSLVVSLAGCVAPVEEETSSSSLIEGATEGSKQASAAAGAVRSSARFELDLARTRGSMEIGFEAAPLLRRTRQGPVQAARAALELYRALIEERGFANATAALNQLLSADPSSPTGPIASIGDGCATFGGFFLRDAITEPDPPLARLVLVHDSSAGAECRIDGTVHYDLRVIADASGGHTLRLEIVWPDGLSAQPSTGEPFIVAPGGSIAMGLAFDGANALSAIVAGADYCVRRGEMGNEACFEDVELAVSGAITATIVDGPCAICASRYGDPFVDGLAGDQLALEIGTSIAVDAIGTVRYDDDSVTFGGAEPLAIEAGFDSVEGWSAMLDGEASVTFEDETGSFTFSSAEGAAVPGLWARVPLGDTTVVLDGCASFTFDPGTTDACFDALAITVEPGSIEGSIRITASGGLTTEALYTFDGLSAQIIGHNAVLDGTLTRTGEVMAITGLFEAFDVRIEHPLYTVGGIVETRNEAGRIVTADFCPGSTYTNDREADVVTLTGCVSLESAVGTMDLGTDALPMTVSLGETVTVVDGPLSYDDAAGNHVLSITFTDWTTEQLETDTAEEYHRRLAGLADIDVLGFRGSVESMGGIEAQFVPGELLDVVSLEGDVAMSIDTGPRIVEGTLDFTGYSATFEDDMIAHMGRIDMALSVSDSSLLPTSAMRVTFGDGTTPLTTRTEQTITTIDGRLNLGLGCATGACNENINIVLTDVAFDSPECGRQHPHAGTAAITGLDPTTSSLIPALRVRCECDGRAGRETLLPRRVNMEFTDATPTEGRIQIPSANGLCGLRSGMCNEPGAAWLRDPSACM